MPCEEHAREKIDKATEPMKINRNEPCPCGSGKKYKKCCLDKQAGKPGSENMQDAMAEVREKLESGQFSSLEEAQAELDDLMQRKNSAPLAEFHGLSSEQMYRFLYFPFESPSLVRFAEGFDKSPASPVLTLFALLAEAIGEKGLKPTAKGNLPGFF